MSFYAQVTNGEITRINISLPYNTATVSIPKNATGLDAFGLYPIVGDEPAYDPATHRMAGPSYQFNGTEVQRVYTVESIPPEEIAARVQAEVIEATQRRLDDFARIRNYDGILSAATYATSTNSQFQKEGQFCVEARDNTWAALYSILTEVQMGTRPVPTGYSDVEGDLPVLDWANCV